MPTLPGGRQGPREVPSAISSGGVDVVYGAEGHAAPPFCVEVSRPEELAAVPWAPPMTRIFAIL